MQSQEKTQRKWRSGTACLFWLALVLLLPSTIKAQDWTCHQGSAYAKPTPVGVALWKIRFTWLFGVRCEKDVTAANVTAKAPCDANLWQRIYHPKRLVVKQACISVIGTLVDASHGRNKDGCRHEADGDGHCFLQLDKGEESLLNAKNRSNEGGNLVIEPICRYRVTQADAIEACKDWHQDLALPPPGSHVRVTGAYVLDTQHGHFEIHPISAIEVLP